MRAIARRRILPLLLLGLGGCGSLLPQPPAPPNLYRLTPLAQFPPALPRVNVQLLVDAPQAQAALGTTRIALSRSQTSMDYFADAAWTDRAPLMVQALLVNSLENSGDVTAAARESLALAADFILRAELRHFEAVYGADGVAPRALVQINLKLVRMPARAIIAQRTVEATAPAARNDMPAIIDAFDAAFHSAAAQIVAWTLDGIAGARR